MFIDPEKERPTRFSTLSFDSSNAGSSIITSSTSSRSTIPGPGALSGKAILALGKVTLRGAENVIIRRRLNTIASKFPLEDTANVKGAERLYDDLLELSRQDLYPDVVRTKALQILLVQIAKRQTQYMVDSLNKWPAVEIQMFLLELVGMLDPIRLSRPGARTEASIKTYWNAYASWESHSLVPFVDFCDYLARSLDPANLVALFRAGILDFLLHSYVTNFRDPLANTDRGAIHRTSIFHSSCNSLLTALYGTKYGFAMILNHPLHALWPTRPKLLFTIPLGLERVRRRMDAWKTASRAVMFWRLHATFDMMLDFTRTIDDSVMSDVCGDLLELSSSETMDLEINIRALRSLHRVFTRGNVLAQRTIQEHFALKGAEHSVQVLSRIIKHLCQLISPHTPESKYFFLQWDHKDFLINAVPHFLHLFMDLANTDKDFLTNILAADVLGLMRPFLEMELRNHTEFQIAPRRGGSLTFYDQQDLAVLDIIKEQGLEKILSDVPSDEGRKQALVYRRNLLCRAFNVFLDRGDNRLFPEFWNTDWDDLPSGLDGSDYEALWIKRDT